MIWRAEESVDRWLAGALARSLVFFASAEANAAADERGRGKDRIMQGGHPFELRKRVAWTYAEVAKSVFLLLFATLFEMVWEHGPPGDPAFLFSWRIFAKFRPEKYGFELYKRFFVEKRAQTRQNSKENKFPNSQIFMISFSR
jgi:hypothetical protein